MHNEAFARRIHGRGRRTLATIAAIGVFGTVSTTTSASVPATTAADAAAKRATFVYTVSADEDFLHPEGIAVAGQHVLRDRLRQGHDLPRRPQRTRGRGVYPRSRLRPQRDQGCRRPAARCAWVRRGVGFDRTTGALMATWSVVEGPAGQTTSPSPPTATPTSLTPSARCSTGSPPPSCRNPSAAEQDLPVFLEWPDPPFPTTGRRTSTRTASSRPPTASTCWSCITATASCSGSGCPTSRSGRWISAATASFSGDGMVITDDSDLYVVRPARSLVAKFRLNARYRPRPAAVGDHRSRLSTVPRPRRSPAIGCSSSTASSRDRRPAPPWTVSSIALP